MQTFKLVRAAVLLLAILFLVAQFLRLRYSWRIAHLFDRAAVIVVGLLSVSYICITASLWVNHLDFPLNLETMEGTILQHFQRAASFAPVYTEPAPEFVPLAYNPLYYYLAVPFAQLFGVNLFTLRLVSVLGAVGAGCLICLIVSRRARSVGWGLAALGLYATAYVVMDVYLDTAHADSWLLLTALLGSYLIDRSRTRGQSWGGLLVLIAAFWLKQHGAFFVIGGVLYLTWREGLRRAIGYWLTAAVLGPGLYVAAGPMLFGPRFHFFTWEIPRRWAEFSGHAVARYVEVIARNYALLACFSAASVWLAARRRLKSLSVWHVQLGCALLTGFLGALDPGSSNNVYIPAGALLIVVGTLGLKEAADQMRLVRECKLYLPAFLISFALLMYDPRPVTVSPAAAQSYRDLIGMLHGLDGPVYAPWIGQLGQDYTLRPAAHWVALEDLIRGPRVNVENHPNTRRLLAPALEPQGNAYVLTNYPLGNLPWLAFLEDYYVPTADFGERFAPLRGLPTHFDNRWPRYLYRYAPEAARGVKKDGRQEK